MTAPARWALLAAGLLTVAAADDGAAPVFGVALPEGYRDWPVIAVAHEAGANDDLRAVLGNAIAMQAFRNGTRPFPDGTIIARLAWRYTPSPQNDAAFGREQSFVAGTPINVQISVKDAARYAATGGWGYAQFEDGKPDRSAALLQGCAPCHARLGAADDRVFTRYAP